VLLSQPSKDLALIYEPASQWVGIVGGRRKNERVTDTALSSAHRLMTQAMDAVRAAAGPAASDDELMSVLGLCEGVVRQLDRVTVDAVAGLERRGVFTERGYKSSAAALADLLRCERFEARRRVVAAEQVAARVGLDGAGLPARMPATAVEFEAGRAGLRHVEAIARVLATPAAERLTPEQWAGAEAALADKAGVYTPAELQAWGSALVEALDQDGAEPDDRPPARVNELHLSRLATGGGKLKGRFDDAAMFDAIASVIDAKAPPLTNDDDRTAGQRQAEALADVCGYVLDHGPASLVPECGGQRPHVNVLIRLEDLQDRVRAACLDFGGAVSPESLRLLACDAAAVPIVLCPTSSCCVGRSVGRTTDRSTSPNGSFGSATGFPNSFPRVGSTRTGHHGEKRSRTAPARPDRRTERNVSPPCLPVSPEWIGARGRSPTPGSSAAGLRVTAAGPPVAPAATADSRFGGSIRPHLRRPRRRRHRWRSGVDRRPPDGAAGRRGRSRR
jgi:5-methylcytosine-specific restriction protein A